MKKLKICLSIDKLDTSFEKMRDTLARYADVEVCGLRDFSLDGVDIFIGKMLGDSALATADKLKAIFAYKTGVDDFPLSELERRGIELYNSHVNSRFIAEYAFALATTLVCRTAEFDRAMRRGDWRIGDPYWRGIFGMKVGLVGYGNIGRELNKILKSCSIATYTVDRGGEYNDVIAVPNLDMLCDLCDLLVLSLPQTPQTDGLIGERALNKLVGKYIVNVGRCNCIDENALYDALASGKLAGAAIDTWREKQRDASIPLKPFDKPFDTLDNAVLSSHKAMQTADGHDRYVTDTTDNVLAYILGKTPRNQVDLSKGY